MRKFRLWPAVSTSVVLLLLCASGCSGPSVRGSAHPIEDSLVGGGVDRIPIMLERPHEISSHILRFRSWLAAMVPVRRFGSAQGTPGEMIGLIIDAHLGTAGSTYLLDGRFNTVYAYDSSGAHVASLSGPGRGPGELLYPRSIVLAGAQSLLISDEARLIRQFDHDDGNWRFSRSLPIGFVPFDMCATNQRLYVHGFSETDHQIIHSFDFDGNEIASFSVPYRSPNPIVRQALTEGAILCAGDGSAVYVAFVRMPEIHAYSPSGELLWISEIEGYEQMVIIETETGGTQMGMIGIDQMHMLRSFAQGPAGVLVVQLARYTTADYAATKSYSLVDTYLVDGHTGAGTYIGHEIPVVADVARSLLLSVEDDPFPRATIYRGADTTDSGNESGP